MLIFIAPSFFFYHPCLSYTPLSKLISDPCQSQLTLCNQRSEDLVWGEVWRPALPDLFPLVYPCLALLEGHFNQVMVTFGERYSHTLPPFPDQRPLSSH